MATIKMKLIIFGLLILMIMSGCGKKKNLIQPSPSTQSFSEKILFVEEKNIWMINPDGTEKKQLTFDSCSSQPNISPNGEKIAYTSSCINGNSDIWVMNVDGSDKIRLTEDERSETSPIWSPDGKKIAYIERDDTFNCWNISIFYIERKISKQLTNKCGCSEFLWTPDSEKIIAICNWRGELNIILIYIRDGYVIQLMDDTYSKHGLTISPSGWEIVYISSKNDGYDGKLIMMNIYRKESIVLYEHLPRDPSQKLVPIRALYSPDGNFLLVTLKEVRIEYFSPKIVTINLRNRKVTELAPFESWIGCSWSPTGDKIVVLRHKLGSASVWIMNADGTNKVQILPEGSYSYISWVKVKKQ